MKKATSIMVVFALVWSLAGAAFAQAPASTITPTGLTSGNLGTAGNITSTGTLVNTVMGLVSWLAWAVGLVAVVMGLFSGILFITSAGDPGKISAARGLLLLSIIVVAVAVLSFGIVAISRSIFGI